MAHSSYKHTIWCDKYHVIKHVDPRSIFHFFSIQAFASWSMRLNSAVMSWVSSLSSMSSSYFLVLDINILGSFPAINLINFEPFFLYFTIVLDMFLLLPASPLFSLDTYLTFNKSFNVSCNASVEASRFASCLELVLPLSWTAWFPALGGGNISVD